MIKLFSKYTIFKSHTIWSIPLFNPINIYLRLERDRCVRHIPSALYRGQVTAAAFPQEP